MAGVSRVIPALEQRYGLSLGEILRRLYIDDGLSTRQIAQILGVTNSTVSKWCRERGIPTRPFRYTSKIPEDEQRAIVEQYLSGMSAEEIARVTGYTGQTVQNIVRRHGYTLRHGWETVWRKYEVAHDYFDVIDTPLKAYFLGFIAADGTIAKDRGSGTSLRIQVQERDAEILQLLRDEVCPDMPLRKVQVNYKGKVFYHVKLQINSKRLCDGLEAHGIHPRKTWEFERPIGVPDELLHHYVRGFFDGDGSVAVTKPPNPLMVFFCGTPATLTWLTQVFREKCSVAPNKVCLRTEKFATLSYSGMKAFRIRDWMYPTGTEVGLSRKKAKLFSVAPSERG